MDYIKFIPQFKTSKDQEALCKKHIVKQYLPYATKLTLAKSIAKACTHIEVDGKEIYKKDTPSQYFTTIMQMVQQYTDITFDGNIVDKAYDALMEVGALPMLLSSISETEITEFRTLVDMCVSDIYDNERDLTSFLETKLEAISMSTDQMLKSLGDTIVGLQKKTDNTEETADNIDDFPMNKPIEEEQS